MNSSRQRRVRAGALSLGHLAALGLVLALTVGSECQDSEVSSVSSNVSGVTSPDVGSVAAAWVPTVADVEAVLDLTSDQREALSDALDQWRSSVSSRDARGREGPGRGPRCGGEGPEPTDQDPPIVGFLETSGKILERDQFVGLVELLAQRRESAREKLGRLGGRGEAGREPGDRGHGMRRAGGRGPGDGECDPLEESAAELGLSGEQRSQILDALQEMREAREALWAQSGDQDRDPGVLRESMDELRAGFDERLREILTPEQYELLEKLRAERRSEMQKKREADRATRSERRIDFLTRILGLSDSQRGQVREIDAETMQEIAALHERVRSGEASFEDARTESARAAEETGAAIREVLTPEQAEIFDALKGLLPGHGRPK